MAPVMGGSTISGMQLARVAALMGDPSRATMLSAMLDGRSHRSGALADAAGIAAATASGHLAMLREAGLVTVATEGRRRYYRLASAAVAGMLEAMMAIPVDFSPRPQATPRVPAELREARTCYDHIAGRLGVAIGDALARDEGISLTEDGFEIAERGKAVLREMGIVLDAGVSRRPLCRSCLDWSERKPHLAGRIGAALLDRAAELGWVKRLDGTRALRVTATGATEFHRRFGYAPAGP